MSDTSDVVNTIYALITIHAVEARPKSGNERAEAIARRVGQIASFMCRTDVSDLGPEMELAHEFQANALELYSELVIDGFSPEAMSDRLLQ